MRCGIYPLARQKERQCISCVFRAGGYYLPHATTCLEFLGKVVPPLGFTRWQPQSCRTLPREYRRSGKPVLLESVSSLPLALVVFRGRQLGPD